MAKGTEKNQNQTKTLVYLFHLTHFSYQSNVKRVIGMKIYKVLTTHKYLEIFGAQVIYIGKFFYKETNVKVNQKFLSLTWSNTQQHYE